MTRSKIVRVMADLLLPFILMFGFYIVIHGHLTPGGGFQGGAVIATGFLLLLVAYRSEHLTKRISYQTLKNTETAGLLLFVGTALFAVVLGVGFFTNWLLNTGFIFGTQVSFGPNPGFLGTAGTIPIMNLAVGFEVLGAMSIIVLYMIKGLNPEEADL